MKTTRKTAGRDGYLELVQQFPLVAIKTEKQYDRAVAFLKKLAIRDEAALDEGEAAYLEALALFVEDYQNKHHGLEAKRLAPLEALRYLMAESAMKPGDLGRILGNASLASQILRGNRELSKANIIALAAHFKVGAGLFLQG